MTLEIVLRIELSEPTRRTLAALWDAVLARGPSDGHAALPPGMPAHEIAAAIEDGHVPSPAHVEPAPIPAPVSQTRRSPAAPKFYRSGSRWTRERDEALAVIYPPGSSWDEITATLNSLAGPPITDLKQIVARVKRLHLRRSPEYIAALQLQKTRRMLASRAASQPRAPTPVAARPPSSEPLPGADGESEASFKTIAAWAADCGLHYDGTNIDEINRMRARHRRPPFIQIGP